MKNYEFAKHIETKEDIKNYLMAFLQEDGVSGLIDAMGHVAKHKGMTAIAEKAGVNRQNLYRTLKKGSRPDFITIYKVLDAFGCKLEVK
jgi:probable addiction module antidote protein